MRFQVLGNLETISSKVRALSGSPSIMRANYYREEAKRVRERAAATRIPDIRDELQLIARQYDQMAEALERSVNP